MADTSVARTKQKWLPLSHDGHFPNFKTDDYFSVRKGATLSRYGKAYIAALRKLCK